jgi:exodeoxyribonuclease VII large subunit
MSADEEIRPENAAPARTVYSVSRLNRAAGALLEGEFPSVWVEGELSNLAAPSSGHLYFSLKDASAQLRCAMFRNRRQLLRFRPADGAQVLLRGRLSLYQPRGDYQLIVEHMEEAGDGALRRAYEQLKARLAAEGLFDEERKREIPELPRRIGVITSPTGAAVRDVLTVLRRRFAAIPVLVYPVPVQGKTAAAAIARMIRLAAERAECDVLILCRGGGSLEDLWCFNEEVVARAIADCPIPIVTGIGHEVDFTIADFAADLRAPTPSGAAEHVSPDGADWLRHYARLENRLAGLARQALARQHERLQWLARGLQRQHPRQRLRQQAQRVDELEQRLQRALHAGIERRGMRLRQQHERLLRHSPLHRIRAARTRGETLARGLERGMQLRLERLRAALARHAGELDALSPLATLQRGYAIVTRVADGAVLHDARAVRPGDSIDARLARGRLRCTVVENQADDDVPPPATTRKAP